MFPDSRTGPRFRPDPARVRLRNGHSRPSRAFRPVRSGAKAAWEALSGPYSAIPPFRDLSRRNPACRASAERLAPRWAGPGLDARRSPSRKIRRRSCMALPPKNATGTITKKTLARFSVSCVGRQRPCQIGVSGTWGVPQAALVGDCPGKRPSARRERPFGGRSARNPGEIGGLTEEPQTTPAREAARSATIQRFPGPCPGLGRSARRRPPGRRGGRLLVGGESEGDRRTCRSPRSGPACRPARPQRGNGNLSRVSQTWPRRSPATPSSRRTGRTDWRGAPVHSASRNFPRLPGPRAGPCLFPAIQTAARPIRSGLDAAALCRNIRPPIAAVAANLGRHDYAFVAGRSECGPVR